MMIPCLETDRLTLRAPVASDMDAYAAFCSSDRSAFIGGPFSRLDAWRMLLAQAGQWYVRGFGRWIVEERETGLICGMVGLHHPEIYPEPELAWSLFDGAEGRNIAFEAACASRRYARDELGWTTLISLVEITNPRSQALAERLGAVRDGHFEHPTVGPIPIWRHDLTKEVPQ